jgi:hypothetical protein
MTLPACAATRGAGRLRSSSWYDPSTIRSVEWCDGCGRAVGGPEFDAVERLRGDLQEAESTIAISTVEAPSRLPQRPRELTRVCSSELTH